MVGVAESSFADCLRRGKDPEPNGREGLADVRIIQALLRSARDRAVVQLPPFDRRHRPTPSQEAHRPPVDMPPLVHAERPSA